jgi:NADH:ubiquinone oxidoreductase subunit 6 (subunit J)
MTLISFFTVALLLVALPFFALRVQTIKNLIFFAALITLVAASLGQYYHVHYFPIFMMLIYIGAVIVSALFVVLTFDLRKEYRSGRSFVSNYLSILSTYFLLTPTTFLLSLHFSGALVLTPKTTLPGRLNLVEIYAACCDNPHFSNMFCDDQLKLVLRDRGLYDVLLSSSNDLFIVSSTFYTTHSLLFLTLSILLSLALVAAMSIIKNR